MALKVNESGALKSLNPELTGFNITGIDYVDCVVDNMVIDSSTKRPYMNDGHITFPKTLFSYKIIFLIGIPSYNSQATSRITFHALDPNKERSIISSSSMSESNRSSHLHGLSSDTGSTGCMYKVFYSVNNAGTQYKNIYLASSTVNTLVLSATQSGHYWMGAEAFAIR